MSDPFAETAAYFDRLVQRHGASFEALDYGSAERQRARFEVLGGVLDLTGCTVLDVGCGLAHYADWLEERFEGVVYSGIELSPRMAAAARARRPDLDIREGNVLDMLDDEYDVLTANGIFYLLGEDAPALLRSIVTRMWACCRRAVVFSSLSAWADYGERDEFHADPLETLAFCRTLTPSLVLRHDYLPHDFTVYLYRQARP